ncbi:MAG: polysaccharide biosynthesis C-terminal domain-containing protein, partial [Sinobacterium sp.]|nr:polysaccharide biosynthesis C-terminal domain-containing protein [Sinobacterium sp.]
MPKHHSLKHELIKLTQLSVPILIAQLSFTAMGLIDTIMAGHYSEIDLAAIAIGTSITIPLLLFGQALLFSVTAKAAPHWGAKAYKKAGVNFKEGLLLALISGLPLLFSLLFLSTQLEKMGISHELAVIAKDYQFYIALSLPITGLYQASRSFIEATGQTRPIMVINLLGLLANIPLNYLFIYGFMGVPAMGSV